MDERVAQLEALLDAASALGVRELSLGVDEVNASVLLCAGGTLSGVVVAYASEAPSVVETAHFTCNNVTVRAGRKPRLASRAETRALDSSEAYFNQGDHKAVELHNAD